MAFVKVSDSIMGKIPADVRLTCCRRRRQANALSDKRTGDDTQHRHVDWNLTRDAAYEDYYSQFMLNPFHHLTPTLIELSTEEALTWGRVQSERRGSGSSTSDPRPLPRS